MLIWTHARYWAERFRSVSGQAGKHVGKEIGGATHVFVVYIYVYRMAFARHGLAPPDVAVDLPPTPPIANLCFPTPQGD